MFRTQLFAILVLFASNGMQAMHRAKKYWKESVSAAAGAGGYWLVDEAQKFIFQKQLEPLSFMEESQASKVRQFLKSTGVAKPSFVDEIDLFELPSGSGGAFYGEYGPSKAMFVCSKESNDFLTLHEFGHSVLNHVAYKNQLLKSSIGLNLAGWSYYLLKSSAKKRFIVAPLGLLASLYPVVYANNLFVNRCEKQADDFAIEHLKKVSDIHGLRKGAQFFEEHKEFVEQQTLATLQHGLGISPERFKQIESKTKFGAEALRLFVNPHPPIADRVSKINLAIEELEARQRIKE